MNIAFVLRHLERNIYQLDVNGFRQDSTFSFTQSTIKPFNAKHYWVNDGERRLGILHELFVRFFYGIVR